MNIPEKVVNFNVYDDSEKLVGVSGEITLPSFEAMTETISGAGIAGEYESPTPGHFGSTTIDIPFRTIRDKSFNLFEPKAKTIFLRAAQQSYSVSSGEISHSGLKITLKVMPKGIALGSLKVGGMTETTNTLELLYIKIEENVGGNLKELLEIDKINFIYKVNGADYLESIRSQI